jgi:hypothetical protein
MHEPAKGHLKKQNITYAKGLRKVADGFRRGLWPPVRLRCSHPNLGAFIAKLLSYAEDLGLGFGGDLRYDCARPGRQCRAPLPCHEWPIVCPSPLTAFHVSSTGADSKTANSVQNDSVIEAAAQIVWGGIFVNVNKHVALPKLRLSSFLSAPHEGSRHQKSRIYRDLSSINKLHLFS